MNYIYHIKPDPFIGTSLIPLNSMDRNSELYKSHAEKYIGRENLMLEMIPKLNCKWNDVVQFSTLDPQVLLNKLKQVFPEMNISPFFYFKIPMEEILLKHEAAIFHRRITKNKGDFSIDDQDIELIHCGNYKELSEVPDATINYWHESKKKGSSPLWFPYVPHVFIKGIIETKDFEVCQFC